MRCGPMDTLEASMQVTRFNLSLLNPRTVHVVPISSIQNDIIVVLLRIIITWPIS